MENIMKLIALRSGYFAIFAFICLILFLFAIFVIAKIQMIKRKQTNIYYPAIKFQRDHFKTEYNPDKFDCYIDHSFLDANNIILAFNIPLEFNKRQMLHTLNKHYNIILIHRNITEDNMAYNLNHLITYVNEFNLPICRVCSDYNIKLIRRPFMIKTKKSDKLIGEYMIEV